jgi:hypothetical protein
MNVTQFLARLSRGPVSNLSMSNEGNGTILAAKIPAVIGHLNEALLKLYARFDLLEKELIIECDETVTSYKLSSKYAVSQAATYPLNKHYIKDAIGTPFTDDLIKVMRVYTTGSCGPLPLQLPLNDDNQDKSLFTPQHDVLQVPDPVNGVPLYLIYQAMHAPITEDPVADGFGDQEIVIPPILEPGLLSYVAYLIYMNMNGQEHGVKASEHLGAYENLCAEVIDKDLVNSSLSSTNTKFDDRGFC